nr:hypothetical protein [Piscinibacter defluvii]
MTRAVGWRLRFGDGHLVDGDHLSWVPDPRKRRMEWYGPRIEWRGLVFLRSDGADGQISARVVAGAMNIQKSGAAAINPDRLEMFWAQGKVRSVRYEDGRWRACATEPLELRNALSQYVFGCDDQREAGVSSDDESGSGQPRRSFPIECQERDQRRFEAFDFIRICT